MILTLVETNVQSGQSAVGAQKVWVTRSRLLEQGYRLRQALLFGLLIFESHRLHIEIAGNQVVGWRFADGSFLAFRYFHLELISDRLSDFTLDGKDISHVAVVGLRPEMGIGAGVDKLCVDAQMIARRLDAAFQEMCDAELLTDLPRVSKFAGFVRAGRGAANHFEIGDFGQIGENFILDARRKVGVLFVVAQVLEGQSAMLFSGTGLVV